MLINHYLAVIDYKAHEHYGFFSEFSTATHSHLFSSAGVITSAKLCSDFGCCGFLCLPGQEQCYGLPTNSPPLLRLL